MRQIVGDNLLGGVFPLRLDFRFIPGLSSAWNYDLNKPSRSIINNPYSKYSISSLEGAKINITTTIASQRWGLLELHLGMLTASVPLLLMRTARPNVEPNSRTFEFRSARL
jgi:hypothetical protein